MTSLLMLLLASPLMADNDIKWLTVDNSHSALLSIYPAKKIIIKCGYGNVAISTETGKATFDNCEPDEGAKALYKAFEIYFRQQNESRK